MSYSFMLDNIFSRLEAKKININTLGLDKKVLTWLGRHQKRMAKKEARATIASMVKRNPKLKSTLSAL